MLISKSVNEDRLQNLQKELFGGLIRLHVLYHAAHEPIFGLGIIEELARHGYKLSPGTMYPILHGMEQRGLLRSKETWIAGRRRLIYRATPLGRSALKLANRKVRELFGELIEREGKPPHVREQRKI